MAVSDLSPFFAIPPSEHLAGNASAFAIAAPDSPVTGHSLLVSRRLIETWWQATPQEQADLLSLVGDVKRLLDDQHGPTGYTVGFDSGQSAGQQIPHLHLHLIPRFGASSGTGIESLTASADADRGFVRLADGTSAPLGPALLSLLETSTYDRVDLVVSFVMESGLKVIADPLADAVERGAQLRVLTTDYLYRTEPRALHKLHDLGAEWPERVQLRVFESRGIRSFHPKGYLFHSSTDDQAAAWVGSSNLSASGLEGGIEWNVGLDTVRPMLQTFEELWAHSWTVPLTERWIENYQRRRPYSRTSPPPGLLDASVLNEAAAEPANDGFVDELVPAGVDPADVTEEVAQPYAPRELQAEALAALEATRAEGHRAGLVVMATGLGKTWLAAFDTARPQFGRVLFLAHREEILRQSLEVFRRVQPDRSLGIYMAQHREDDADVVFASVQTLHRNLDHFDAAEFDYVVVDEFHHAAASSYRKVIDHFEPAFLLGLTATPERMDGADLLGLCGDNLVYEANLVEGINRNELVPFEYHGIKDIVDFAPIPWRNGKFDPDALAEAIETHERAAHAHREWAGRAGQRTLAFCQTTAHADFMASWFRAQGLRTASVHSHASSDPRRRSVKQLEDGELDVLFAVDIFNEGFDLPAIDTVLMLRPTDSPVIFLQQLGRGLRLGEDKEKLVVVDFIGNHRSFLSKPRALLGLGTASSPSTADVLKALEDDDWVLPVGCTIDWQLGSIDLLKSLAEQQQRFEPGSALVAFVEAHTEEFGDRPTAMQALRAGYNPGSARRSHNGWFDLLSAVDVLGQDERRLAQKYRGLLDELERGSMTRAYKMVLIRTLLHAGALHSGQTIADLAASSRKLVQGDPRLMADVRAGATNPDPESATAQEWESFWRKNPIAAWTGAHRDGKGLFRLDGDRFVPTFSIEEHDRDGADALVAELVEWRLGDYLLKRTPERSTAIECAVSHSGGKPIIRFDRAKNPTLPTGDTPFLANGDRYVGSFVKIALNVATRDGETGNALHALLRGWFGPSAGLPGSRHRVLLERVGDEWVMRPVGAVGESTGTVLPFYPSYAIACGAFDEPAEGLHDGRSLEILDVMGGTTDPDNEFVAVARGESMAAGDDPVLPGDLVLLRWVRNRTREDLVGQRILVELNDGAGPVPALKELARGQGGFELRSPNPSTPPVSATGDMRIVAEYVRRLDQREFNPLADRIGSRFKRQDIPPLYGTEFNPGNWNSGHVSIGDDVLLFVTLHKGNMDQGGDYDDRLEGEDTLIWSSQASTGPDSKKGREILDSPANGKRIHAWIRRRKADVAFEYRGLVTPLGHQGARPMSVRFRLLTPTDDSAATRLR